MSVWREFLSGTLPEDPADAVKVIMDCAVASGRPCKGGRQHGAGSGYSSGLAKWRLGKWRLGRGSPRTGEPPAAGEHLAW